MEHKKPSTVAGKEIEANTVPDLILDSGTGTMYKRGRFFGKGGFAKCYEITEVKTGNVYAGKIVSKKIISNNNQKEKMTQEISIHRSLNHKHVVGFHSFFEDTNNVYIILELCRKRSMMELHKRRKAMTEPEVRYFFHQILLGVEYLHKKNIIHRDLKLGNLFLNDELAVKIGDFGLAAKLEFQGERKRTLCGTPNYIAPEILTKKGHSFEVDVWSMGCILYTLLYGNPPFETSTLKETYSRIKRCDYRFPTRTQVSKEACNLIHDMLLADPKLRPKVDAILRSEFLTAGYIPSQLPVSCLTMPPRFSTEKLLSRKPLMEVNNIGDNTPVMASPGKKSRLIKTGPGSIHDCLQHLKDLSQHLTSLLKTNPGMRGRSAYGDEATDPAAQPVIWICKWVDYSDKYGFGYQLSDDSVGVVFNDNTKLVVLSNGKNVHYITRDGDETYYTSTEYPATLEKKMKLLSYFQRYMVEHLVKAGASVQQRDSDSVSRIPCMINWCRSSSAVIMFLNNGTLQINFSDHTKIILCPHMAAVTYIDSCKNFRTFHFKSILKNGCSPILEGCLKYALEKIPQLETSTKALWA